MKSKMEFQLDKRELADIHETINKLAKTYTPEWNFEKNNPDLGSVIGIIFAAQMEDNLRKYNQVMDNYRVEFVNMLGISLLPARPACVTVIMELVENSIPGIPVKKGTKLLAAREGEEENQIVFETIQEVYITHSKLQDIFTVSGESGKIIPILGNFKKLPLIEGMEIEEETQIEQAGGEGGNVFPAFSLFDDTAEGIDQNAIVIYHERLFDVEMENIFLRFAGNGELLRKVEEGKFILSYYCENGVVPVEKWWVEGNTLRIQKEKPCKKVVFLEKEYSVLALQALESVEHVLELEDIVISSEGKYQLPGFIHTGTTDLEEEKFAPFGDSLSLFAECYIGHDTYFSQKGAKVTVDFEVSFEIHEMGMSMQQEKEELKVIKRKPRIVSYDVCPDTFPEEISIAYFNGTGWKRLETMGEYRYLFAKGLAGRCHMEFEAPGDWEESSIGGYHERCIKIQLLRADNCYMQPCNHHYPVISNMQIAYTYKGQYERPHRLERICGSNKMDLTSQLVKGEGFTAFAKSEYDRNALYLGLHKKLEEGPVSILFQIEKESNFKGMRISFEYSSQQGFKQMKVLDHTENMSTSGTVLFMPPSDMAALEIEGKKRYWIKIVEVKRGRGSCSLIKDIKLNALEAYNIETLEEEDFYLDEVKPFMEFKLRATNILDADVWVNETDKVSPRQMKTMLEEMPGEIRAEYNFKGELENFFVRWKEIDSFDTAEKEGRSYILDRMNNSILFGDGVSTMIPNNLREVAFMVQVRCCDGQYANVDTDTIQETFGNLMFVNRIYNPIPAYGGSNMENVENALRRGANILSARRRLVSEADYIREIKAFSDNIDKVDCIVGFDLDGRKKDTKIRCVILMKDFRSGSYSFCKLQDRIKDHIKSCCELVIKEDDLYIVEPVFVEISVELWVEVMKMEEGFELQNRFQKELDAYFEPIGEGGKHGWDIGVLPGNSQILMKLNALKGTVIIRKTVITASYKDEAGVHEKELVCLKHNPFYVCTGGKHKVHIAVVDKQG